MIIAWLIVVSSVAVSGYRYDVKSFRVPVDHFSFARNDSFDIRYLINGTYWDGGPILFYTGNEGNIEMFANNTGFVWEIAPAFKAAVVFAEHRYYGESLPFGNKSFADPESAGYLTSQQALADYVDLIEFLTANRTSPVIAVGGSYGGMLAAYLRMKYPHVVVGALAASAPIWQFPGMTPCEPFYRITTSNFKVENANCSHLIRRSWAVFNNMSSRADALTRLSKKWKLCGEVKAQDIETFKEYLKDVYTNLAMANYPYPANFLADLPAYPVREFCRHLQNGSASDEELVDHLFNAVSVYFNYTGKSKCLDWKEADPSSLGDDGWDFQSCTEMIMPLCSDGKRDMFEKSQWDMKRWSDRCWAKWKVRPRPDLVAKAYGGKNLGAHSNIIFSNGLLDPWSSGGVIETISDSVVSVIIPEGAHHLDLRASNPADPDTVRMARNLYQQHFKKWIAEHSGTGNVDSINSVRA